MAALLPELRLAVRSLRRSPAFTTTVVLILAIGIGMSVAMFSVFHAVLLQRLPVLDQDRIVVLWTVREGDVEATAGKKELDQFRHETRTLHDVAGVVHWGAVPFPLTDGTRTRLLNQAIVSGNFFDVLGARPAIGRLLRVADEQGGRFQPESYRALDHAIVLSYATWLDEFGGDPAVIGHHLSDPYTRWTYTIVGVGPPGLDYPAGAGYWVPIGKDVSPSMIAVGRLRPGVPPAAARTEYLSVMQRLVPQVRFTGADVRTLPKQMLGDVRPALLILTAAVTLLLGLACVNVGNLLLLRAAGRSREIAIRRAIGASYADVARQFLTESAVLAAGGGLLGAGCAAVLLRLLLALAPPQLPRTDVIRLSGIPVLLAVATTIAAVLVFGVVPALLAARADVGSPLRMDTRSGTESRPRRRLRQLLVASQVALALVMVTGAGLLARSLERLQRLDLGLQPDHLSFFAIAMTGERYNSEPRLFALGDAVFPRLRAIPGVTAVTPVIIPPLLGPNVFQWQFQVEGQSPDEAQRNPLVPVEGGSPDYFRTLGIPILRGHGFSGPDGPGAPPEVVVSEGVARRFWPHQDPLGKRVLYGPIPDSTWKNVWRTVVGVTPDIHFRARREATPMVFLRWQQSFWQGNVALRTTAPLSVVLPAVRRAIQEVDPQLTIWQAETMDDFLGAPLAEPRLNALLLAAFGLVALLLAAMGLYGVMASAVRQQTRELGVRMALGATPERLRRDVLGAALGLTALGTLVGAVVAVASSKLLTTVLFEVSPTDPIALSGACALLLLVGLGAAYVPAHRATKIDPAQALRTE